MAHATSQFSVFKLYQSVIDDVVNGMREAFLDEGVDEQVLQELRILWESKLVSTKAVDSTDNPAGQEDTNGHTEKPSKTAPPTTSASQNQQQKPPTPSQPQVVLPADLNTQVPIQITMPRLSSDPPGMPQRQITIHVPASCIHTNKLQDILSLPAIQGTLSLPPDLAAARLQGQINLALQGDMKAPSTGSVNSKGFVQVDGQTAGDSSEDEDEDDDDDDDLDDDADDRDDEKEEEQEEEGQDEEPLNSDDDVSDAEGSSERLYDIENVVVCQFDKITRTRNKWKFHLKDGIMNLNGKDYVFQKATGDAEW